MSCLQIATKLGRLGFGMLMSIGMPSISSILPSWLSIDSEFVLHQQF